MSQRRVVITADDFGLGVPVNEAVEIAHREGVLSAASLMVAGDAAQDAVARARRHSSLRVGLHVVVVDGRPVLPPRAIPALVDRDGWLDRSLVRAGVRYFFLPRARRQLYAEVRAQFEAFRATGLPLDHVDAHRHMHLHPTVLSAILALAPEFGIRVVRLPREPLAALRGASRARRLGALTRTVLLAPWLALMGWRLRRAGIDSPAQVFGLGDSGAMTEEVVLRLVAQLPAGSTEIYFHPATASSSEAALLPMSAERHEAELRALCSPRVRAALTRALAPPAGAA